MLVAVVAEKNINNLLNVIQSIPKEVDVIELRLDFLAEINNFNAITRPPSRGLSAGSRDFSVSELRHPLISEKSHENRELHADVGAGEFFENHDVRENEGIPEVSEAFLSPWPSCGTVGEQLQKIMKTISKPYIITLRPVAQGGHFHGRESRRLAILYELAELAPSYIDLESFVDDTFINQLHAAYPSIQIIRSYHNFQQTPHNLLEIFTSLIHPHVSLYKLVTHAKKSLDNLRVLHFLVKQLRHPFISEKSHENRELHADVGAGEFFENHDVRENEGIPNLAESEPSSPIAQRTGEGSGEGLKIFCQKMAEFDLLRTKAKQTKILKLTTHCMGPLGLPSRIMGAVYGNYFTYASLPQGGSPLADCPDFRTLIDIYSFRRLNRETKVFALLGDPVDHSVGHIFHNKVFFDRHINAVYLKIKLNEQECSDFFKYIKSNLAKPEPFCPPAPPAGEGWGEGQKNFCQKMAEFESLRTSEASLGPLIAGFFMPSSEASLGPLVAGFFMPSSRGLAAGSRVAAKNFTQCAKLAVIKDPSEPNLRSLTPCFFAPSSCGLTEGSRQLSISKISWDPGASCGTSGGPLPFFHGFSVTMPLKEKVVPYIDIFDQNSQAIGAVNTIVVKEGRLHACNTDGAGALDAIEIERPVESSHILIIGAGGAAKAIAHACCHRKPASLTLVNRTLLHAARLAEQVKAVAYDFDSFKRCPESQYDIIINTIPNTEKNDAFVLDLITPYLPSALKSLTTANFTHCVKFLAATLDPAAKPRDDGIKKPATKGPRLASPVFMNIDYSHEPSVLLTKIKQTGCSIISPQQMFINQAKRQLDYWLAQVGL